MFKHKTFTAFFVFIGGLTVLVAAEEKLVSKKKEIKARATHAEIASRQSRRDLAEERKEVHLKDVHKAAHRKAREQKGLIARSSIISSSYAWTLVPRNAILHVPPLYRKRVNEQRSGKLVGWRDFYAQNRSWIRLLPVTIAQASGEDPLTEDYLDSLRKTGLLVVAVCKGGPISVKIPKKVEAKEAGNPAPLPVGALAPLRSDQSINSSE